MNKKVLMITLIAMVCSLNLFSAEKTDFEILTAGLWHTKDVLRQEVEYGSGKKLVLNQSYDYNFFDTGRFTICTFVEVPADDSDDSEVPCFNLNINIRLYGTFTLDGKKIIFHVDPEETYCAFRDSFVSQEEYDQFMKAYIDRYILPVNEIVEISRYGGMELADKSRQNKITLGRVYMPKPIDD